MSRLMTGELFLSSVWMILEREKSKIAKIKKKLPDKRLSKHRKLKKGKKLLLGLKKRVKKRLWRLLVVVRLKVKTEEMLPVNRDLKHQRLLL
jgi:transposase